MTRIKCCGLKTLQDARLTRRGGAQFGGLVFAKGSPREITTRQAARLSRILRPCEPVGLFVNKPPAELARIAADANLQTVQLHGQESPTHATALPHLNILKAFPFDGVCLHGIEPWLTARPPNWTGLLVDAPPHGSQPGQAGGSGITLDWRSLRRCLTRLRRKHGALPPVFLAGGLHAGNSREAIRLVQPDALDASSGLESTRGIKDPEKLIAFARSGSHR